MNSFSDGTETMVFRNATGDLTILSTTGEAPMNDTCPCGKETDGGLCDECQAKW